MRAGREQRIEWKNEPKYLEYIRQLYTASRSNKQIRDGLEETFGVILKEKALESVIARYLREEIAARNRAKGNERKYLQDEIRKLARTGISTTAIATTAGASVDVVRKVIPPWERPSQPASFMRFLNKQVFDPIPDDPIIDGGRLITELLANECRWPIGKDADGLFRFCGCHFVRTSNSARPGPYCDVHLVLSIKDTDKPRGPVKIEIVATGRGDGPIPVNVVVPTEADDLRLAA